MRSLSATIRTEMGAVHPAVAVLDRERTKVESALERIYATRLRTVGETLAVPIRYALEAGGKRLRPILCISAYRATSGQSPVEPVYDAAAALELIHTYSLLHDDLPCMDDDDFRRGRATAHRVYGADRTALAGAVMIPLAAAVLDSAARQLGLNETDRTGLAGDLVRGAGAAGMVGGQVMDLGAEDRSTTLEELQAIHSRKTGALFAASMRIGGRLSRQAESVLAGLGRSGELLGLAFQVTDDILDETGEASVLGKTAGADREHGKATYPGLMGIENARHHAGRAATQAVEALRSAGVADDELESLIDFAVSRDR